MHCRAYHLPTANHDEAMQTLTQSAAEREAEFAARITELERFIERKGFDAVRLQTIDDDGAGAENVETAAQSQAALDEVAALAETLQAQQERSDALVQRLQVVCSSLLWYYGRWHRRLCACSTSTALLRQALRSAYLVCAVFCWRAEL